MPFVAFTKERVAQVGLGALDLTLEFDGKAVLERDAAYLANNLQLEGIEVKPSSESENEKLQEECRPGRKMILFSVGVRSTAVIGIFQHGVSEPN